MAATQLSLMRTWMRSIRARAFRCASSAARTPLAGLPGKLLQIRHDLAANARLAGGRRQDHLSTRPCQITGAKLTSSTKAALPRRISNWLCQQSKVDFHPASDSW
jgi:hypothetical protein